MSKQIKSVLSSEAQKATVEQLQGAVVDLTNLALQGKQLHWNLVGPRFRILHEQLDELVDFYRLKSDLVAERIVALGSPADGRVETIAKNTSLPNLPEGWVQDNHAVALMVERLQSVIANFRQRMDVVGEHDLVSEDIMIGIIGELEKQSWMLQAEHT